VIRIKEGGCFVVSRRGQGRGVFEGGVFLVLVFCLWGGGVFAGGCVFSAGAASSYRHLEARGQERL
jgi:hypothetical protein